MEKQQMSVSLEVSSLKPKLVESPPEELVYFRTLSKSAQKESASAFFKQDFIMDYLDEKWKVERCNKDGFLRLIELRNSADEEIKKKINFKLAEFKKFIMNQDNPFQSLMLDFDKYNVPEPDFGEKVSAVKEAFAGTVNNCEGS